MQEHKGLLRKPQATVIPQASAARSNSFFAAVQYKVVEHDHKLAERFNVPIDAGGVVLHAGFLNGQSIVAFAVETPDWQATITRVVGEMLVIERALRHELTLRVVCYWTASGTLTAPQQAYAKALGIKLQACNNVDKCARMIATL